VRFFSVVLKSDGMHVALFRSQKKYFQIFSVSLLFSILGKDTHKIRLVYDYEARIGNMNSYLEKTMIKLQT